jgi:uncharacterized protein (DUF488 family)
MLCPMQIFTIGYEKATLADFLASLRQAGVKSVLDVRDLPLSRRPGFSKRQLAAELEEAGIAYHHLKGLGTPKEGRVAARLRQRERFWAIVEEKMATPAAEFDLQRAAELARERPSCLLCYEADHRQCHRLRVAEALEKRFGFEIRHLAVI